RAAGGVAGGGAAREAARASRIRRQPARLDAGTLEPAAAGAGWIVPVRVRVTDREGFLRPDSLALRITSARGAGITPAETLVTTADGLAWGYLRWPRPREGVAPRATVALAARLSGHAGAHEATAVTVDLRQAIRTATRGAWSGFALAMPEARPITHAPGTSGIEPTVRWLNRDGFAVILEGADGRAIVPTLPGYRAWGADSVPPRRDRRRGAHWPPHHPRPGRRRRRQRRPGKKRHARRDAQPRRGARAGRDVELRRRPGEAHARGRLRALRRRARGEERVLPR